MYKAVVEQIWYGYFHAFIGLKHCANSANAIVNQ